MAEIAQSIDLRVDVDKVAVWGPSSVSSLKKLLSKNFLIPSREDISKAQILPQYTKPSVTIFEKARDNLRAVWLQVRPKNKKTYEGIVDFQSTAVELGIPMETTIATSRQPKTHRLTDRQMRRYGYNDIAQYDFNPGFRPTVWKALSARRSVEKGNTVVALEDDISAALAIAQENKPYEATGEIRTIVYLRKNLVTLKFLLRHAGVTLPENVIPVRNTKQATRHFEKNYLSKAA